MSQKVKTWESHVPGCFGGSDHIFAGHPAEEKRAKELRKVCSEQRIPMDDVAKAIDHIFLLVCQFQFIDQTGSFPIFFNHVKNIADIHPDTTLQIRFKNNISTHCFPIPVKSKTY